ncbi:MAG TPA: ATP-binding protein [Solirubrobacteraceae bacterium]|nr:ATP-binding protein [Solirubrobacteraceae bacterium]
MSNGRIVPLTPEVLDQRLSEAGPLLVEEPPPPDSAWSYAQAAAVLGTFDREGLKPMDEDAGGESLAFLIENSVPVAEGTSSRKWRLRSGVRREALRQLGSREAIRSACELNPQANGDGLRGALMSIAGGPGQPDLRPLAYRELVALREATMLLEGIIADLPSLDAISGLIEQQGVIEPLRLLAGSNFRGRQHELEQLAEYVGVMPSGTLRTLRRSARTFLRGSERPPLLITGPGGIGKSTLLAKFILDHVQQRNVLFAYLDFDRPVLSATEPETILLEAARQIATQADAEDASRWRELQAVWTGEFTRAAQESTGSGLQARLSARDKLIDRFAEQVESSFGLQTPFLLALDTFEEIQYSSPEFADSLWQFLDLLSDRLPMLRTVLAGRAPIENRRCEIVELDALDDEAAIGFLQSHGVSDPEAARLLVKHLGCSPLTLSLAVEIMRRDGCELSSLADVTRQQRLFVLNMDHKTMQVELYRRILSHIHDPAVQQIAHPGLVLPRVTPDLIRHVLAVPCGLMIEDDDRAQELFAKLAAEVSLVRRSDDGALEHRSDLRRAMLPMMREDAPERVAAIHRYAIAYHAGRESDRDRAEEIYHRLASGEDPEAVEESWRPALAPLLRNLVAELPPRAQAYLAGQIGIQVDPQAWREASRLDIERRVEQSARELLDAGRPKDALSALRKAKDRQAGGPLYLCEALAYEMLDEPARALGVVDKALEPAPARASSGTVLKLLALGARVEAAHGAFEAAADRADEGYYLAAAREEAPAMLVLGALRLRLLRSLAGRDRRRLSRLQSRARETAQDLVELPPSALTYDPDSARIVMSEIGELSPILFARFAETAGLPQLRPDRVRRAIIQWNHESRQGLESDAAALAVMENQEAPTPGGAMGVLSGLLARHPLTAGAARALGSEVRHALRDESPSGQADEID